MRRTIYSAALTFLIVCATSAVSQAFVSGSTGSDGAFNPLSNTVIDLSQAGGGPGTGAYDPARWAVIFNYTTINVPAGVTVTFTNHPSGAPVVWLATGNVNIAGTVDLSGASAPLPAGTIATPGPGGFPGGYNFAPGTETDGFGPGGGIVSSGSAAGASYGTPGVGPGAAATYGHPSILPLIGGSGGSSNEPRSLSGGAGGGALLLASSGTVTIASGGSILANGGAAQENVNDAGDGSGGAVRVLATNLSGGGVLNALRGGPTGGYGRVRLEADVNNFTGTSSPPFTQDFTPGPVFPVGTAPSVSITSIAGFPAPSNPNAGINTTEMTTPSGASIAVGVEAHNIPLGTSVNVIVLFQDGGSVTYASTPLAGTLALSTATATIALVDYKIYEIYARANW